MRILWYFHLFLFFFFFLLLPPPFFSFGVLVPFFFLTGNFLEDFLFILCSRTYSNVIAVCLILSCSSYDVSLLRRFVIMRSPPLYVCYSECSSTNVTAGSFMLILFCPWRNLSFFRDKIVLLIPTHFGYSCCKWLFWSINSVLVSPAALPCTVGPLPGPVLLSVHFSDCCTSASPIPSFLWGHYHGVAFFLYNTLPFCCAFFL